MTNELQMKREALADRVIGAVMEAFQKLAEHREAIAQLWDEFERLQPGETIKGCHTKTEFAKVHLRRNIRSVQYMLKGGNPQNRLHEIISPPVLEVEIAHDDWRAQAARGEVYTIPVPTEPLALPSLTGNGTIDNLRRHEFARALHYPYPWYENGVALIPVVCSNLRLAQAVNEQARLMSLDYESQQKAICLEGVIVELMCKEGEAITRKQGKDEQESEVSFDEWMRTRHDMDGVTHDVHGVPLDEEKDED
jgi:hypothetical protein